MAANLVIDSVRIDGQVRSGKRLNLFQGRLLTLRKNSQEVGRKGRVWCLARRRG